MLDWFNKNKNKYEDMYAEEAFESQPTETDFNYQSKKQSNFRFPLIPDDYDEGNMQRRTGRETADPKLPSAHEEKQTSTFRRRRSYRTGAQELLRQNAEQDFLSASSAAPKPEQPPVSASRRNRGQEKKWEQPHAQPAFQRPPTGMDLDKQPTFLRKNHTQMPPSPFQYELQYIDAKPKEMGRDLNIFREPPKVEKKKFFRPSPFVSPVHGRLDTPEESREKRLAYEKSLEKMYGVSFGHTVPAAEEKHEDVPTAHDEPPAVGARSFGSAEQAPLHEMTDVQAESIAEPTAVETAAEAEVEGITDCSDFAADAVNGSDFAYAKEEVPRAEAAEFLAEAASELSALPEKEESVSFVPYDEPMPDEAEHLFESAFDEMPSADFTDLRTEGDVWQESEPYVRTDRGERLVPVNAMMFNEDKMYLRKKELDEQASAPQPRAEHEKMPLTETEEIAVCAYEFPPLELLKQAPHTDEECDYSADEKVQVLDKVLKDFNVGGRVVSMTKGPTVTRYEVQPDPGVKVNKIVNLADDLKLYLAAQDIRIEAPIPGKSMVGIEVPNDHPRPVFLREILAHPDFSKETSATKVALGLNIEGMPVSTDIRKMPHGLIAGSTGSGKSVCINSVLISLLYQAHPDEVKLMLIDPKMVELAAYNALPHLVCPVITDAKAATKALKWAVDEMERRYELFSKIGVRDINRYNELASREERGEKMATLVIIIDELADLMMVAANEVESHICRIAQKARACGIHLILATQRPSVDVITGLIKANIPSRIAFAVSSQIDSRTILDTNGAERLLGKGDMLLSENGSPKLVRVQGTFVSDDEIEEVVSFVKKQMAPQYLFTAEEMVVRESDADEDELFPEVLEFAIETGTLSTSMIQRKFRIGYNRAARIIDVLEEKGYISGANGSKPREVLIDQIE